MNINPISFEKKYKKPRTGKREIQRTQAPVQMPKMSPETSKAELIKQANFALSHVDKIKQVANSAKIRSFEVLEKAKKNREFADGLYMVIKENPNSANKNFSIQYQGITYKVELQNGKYRAIGQSRGFFGKKDVFEFEMKKGELKISILKGYSKEKETNAYAVAEEYHFIQNQNINVFFDTVTDKYKKGKEGFAFNSQSELSLYKTNFKIKPDDFDYGEFETLINYNLYQKLDCYTVGFSTSKNAMNHKHSWHFSNNGMLENYNKDCYASGCEDNEICNIRNYIFFEDSKPIIGYTNYRVVNEKPSFDFQYEF